MKIYRQKIIVYSFCKQFSNFFSWFYKPSIKVNPLNNEKYYTSFGFSMIGGQLVLRDKEKLDVAYKRAWENRDFEINKFWARAAYFWGFIALIFGAYITLISSDKFQGIKYPYFELYIVCLGLLFSIAWYFVIIGSKRWQENWEQHIDKLEDFVSGPIYKTLYYRSSFFSVSKINQVLSVVVISVWLGFLLNYLKTNNFLPDWNSKLKNINYDVLIPLILTLIFYIVFRFGYCKGEVKSKKYKFMRRDDASK